jgi:manganese/zinc/iron transport system permease protein
VILDWELMLLVAVVAVSCAVPGVFLVLRRLALLSDAIGHVILFGIVVSFIVVRDLNSPWLAIGAAASGVLAVALIELFQRSRLVREDAAVGLVFPALFSLAVLLVVRNTANIHLDVDRVLLGDAGLSTLNRREWSGYDVGPRAMLPAGLVLLANFLFVGMCYKELKVATFDPALAATFGFVPTLLHYLLTGLVSLTTVVAFDAAGPVMTIALMVVPPATAWLLSKRLSVMIGLSVVFAISGALVGSGLAIWWDSSIAGAVAVILGLQFGVVLVAAPRNGWLAQVIRLYRQRRAFRLTMLAVHLLNHEGTPAENRECRLMELPHHLRWPASMVGWTANAAERAGWIRRDGELLKLTPEGRRHARQILGEPD